MAGTAKVRAAGWRGLPVWARRPLIALEWALATLLAAGLAETTRLGAVGQEGFLPDDDVAFVRARIRKGPPRA